MDNLPNGFTGFAGTGGRPEGFESAAEASRRSRGIGSDSERASQAQGRSNAAAQAGIGGGMHQRYRNPERPVLGSEIPFDQIQLDSIANADRRWAWAQIDLSAIRHNVAETRRFLQPRCRIMAVVKADGYGHGAVEVAKAALGAGADRLAVATVDEGLDLRRAGISAPVLVLSQPPAASIPLLLAHHLTPALYEPDFAIAYGETADRHGMMAPFHLAINTGMNRIGVRFDEAREFLYQVSFHRALELEGVFTHYATAECPETLDFQRQARRFADAVGLMQQSGFDPGIVHSANTAATFRYPEVQFDMVRIGLALYGLHPCRETRSIVDLRPAMSVHARIVDVRTPAMSEGVSYGLRYRSPGSVKICTVPVGFGDGLRLGLSGNTDFIMAGRYFRQVGDICMDHSMFEVDMRSYGNRERIDPQVGDEVIVVGSQGIAEVSLDEMADKLRTSNYEVALGFGQRLKRVYV